MSVHCSLLTRKPPAQHLRGQAGLLVQDELVLLAAAGSLQALPRQLAREEVDEAVTQGLQVVSARQLWRQAGGSVQLVCDIHVCVNSGAFSYFSNGVVKKRKKETKKEAHKHTNYQIPSAH